MSSTTSSTDVQQIADLVKQKAEPIERMVASVERVIVGQQSMIERLVIGLLVQRARAVGSASRASPRR